MCVIIYLLYVKSKDSAVYKIGLVLEGGGVKGAYQAGAMKALAEFGAEFDGVVGTSIGAVNGALYLQGGYGKVQEVWDNVKLTTVYDLTDEEAEKFKELQIAPALREYIRRRLDDKGTIIDKSYQKSQEFFENLVNEDDMRKSQKDYGVVTYNLSDRKPVEIMMKDIEYGKLVDFVIASATFPVFPPKMIDGKKYIDGGVYDNMPVNLLGRNGYDNMLVIRTNPQTKTPKRKQEREDLNLWFIAPKEDLGAAMAFSSARVRRFMQMGYDDTVFALHNGLEKFLSGNFDASGVYSAQI